MENEQKDEGIFDILKKSHFFKNRLLPALFFLLLLIYTYPIANKSTIVNNNGDDKVYLVGSYELTKFRNFESSEKWLYFYNHIHKPLIIFLTAILHFYGLSYFWYVLPYLFYCLNDLFLFLFLKGFLRSNILPYFAVIFLSVNSVWLYFGLHLLPDIPAATCLMGMVYFLNKFLQNEKPSNISLLMTSFFATATVLFRIEFLPILIVPPVFYLFKIHNKTSKQKTNIFKMIFNSTIIKFIGFFIVSCILFYIFYIYLIEKSANILDYPSLVLEQLVKSSETIQNIGANKGNLLYVPSEILLSFTILPTIFSVLGIIVAIKNKKTELYTSMTILFLLFIISTLIGFIAQAEQRYVTRFFPILTIFLFYFLDDFFCSSSKFFIKNNVIRYFTIAFTCFILIYSSYFLVHKGFGPSNKIKGFEQKMLTVDSKAEEAFGLDKDISAEYGYLFIKEIIEFPSFREYENIYTNVNISSYEKYVEIINKKNLFLLNSTQNLPRNSIIIILSKKEENIQYDSEYINKHYNVYGYIILPKK